MLTDNKQKGFRFYGGPLDGLVARFDLNVGTIARPFIRRITLGDSLLWKLGNRSTADAIAVYDRDGEPDELFYSHIEWLE